MVLTLICRIQEVLSPDWDLDVARYIFWRTVMWLSQYSNTRLEMGQSEYLSDDIVVFLNILERVEEKE